MTEDGSTQPDHLGGPPSGDLRMGMTTPPPNGRRKSTVLVISTVLAVSLLVGVGVAVALVMNHRSDLDAQEKRDAAAAAASESSVAAEESAASESAAAAEELAAYQGKYDDCVRQLRQLSNTLNIVDARLDVGLSQAEYSDLVGAASVAYNRIDAKQLEPGPCLSAGAKLESALISYTKIASKWNDCIYDYNCDIDSIDPDMQVKWASASDDIDRAETLIDRMNPESENFKKGLGDSA
jgi:flagellar basal body-associated protein FliL